VLGEETPIHTASFLYSIPFSRDCSNMLYSNKIESQNDLRQTYGGVSQSHVGSSENQILSLADPVEIKHVCRGCFLVLITRGGERPRRQSRKAGLGKNMFAGVASWCSSLEAASDHGDSRGRQD
jgi:hypothetical protein